MLYPIYVHPGDKTHAHGVTIPDFPGCFSAADNWDDLAINVQQAIELYCEGEDMALPKPSLMESLLHDTHYQDGVWVMIEVDTSKLSGRAVRINITVPELALYQIDKAAKKAGVSRSGFMTKAAVELAEVQ